MTKHTKIEMTGLEPGSHGLAIGRNPGTMSTAELAALGHKRMSPLAALRARCVDCCVGSVSKVRKCVAVNCPAWPFRIGKNPWLEKRVLTEEQKIGARIRLQQAREARRVDFLPRNFSNSGVPGVSLPEKSYPQENSVNSGEKS